MPTVAPSRTRRLRMPRPAAAQRVRLPRHGGRIAIASALALIVVLAPVYLWLRDSSLVAVRDVYVVGLRSEQSDEIRSELREAALGMTTLHVDHEALVAIARRYPAIAEVRTDADPPHKLTIEVVERVPVGVVESGSERLPATASGVLLEGDAIDPQARRALPRIDVGPPASGRRVSDHDALAAVAVLAAAPPELRARVKRIRLERTRGFVLELRNGPDLIFGAASDLEAKWASAARVLADPTARGASAIDVRVPERPAAAGVGPKPDTAPGAQDGQTGPAGVRPQTEAPTDAPASAPTATPSPTATSTPPAAGTAPGTPQTPATP